MRAPTLAAISMHPTGGGIAVVSRLLWEVFQQQWSDDARLLLLMDGKQERTRPSYEQKIRFAIRVARAQAFGNTDWILFSHLGLATVQQGLPRRLRARYGIFLYGTEIWRPLTRGERKVLADADVRVAISPFTASRVMEMHPDIGSVDVCPLALPPRTTQENSSAAADNTIPRLGPHAVLVVGRMLSTERYKGHDELIDGWPTVVAAVPDAQLVIVGQGDDVPRLQEKAAQSAAKRSIVFVGFVSQEARDALYEQAALLALPSRGEGFGLVYLEAMAHRRACLGSIHDAARDVIVDNGTGRLVNQNNIEELAEALIDLLKDDRRRLEMGEAGYRRLQDRFTFEQFRARVGSLLNVNPQASSAL